MWVAGLFHTVSTRKLGFVEWERPLDDAGSGFGWLCWGLTSQSTIFQSCRDGAIASWVINQYFRGVKCLAQGHNTAAVGLEPRTSRSRVRHSTTEPPRSPAGSGKKPIPGFFDEAVYPTGNSRLLVFQGFRPAPSCRWRQSMFRFCLYTEQACCGYPSRHSGSSSAFKYRLRPLHWHDHYSWSAYGSDTHIKPH